MTKGNKDFLLGVLFGFMGIGLYSLMLTGFEHVGFEDVFKVIENLAIPFVFTEVLTAIGVEGIGNIMAEFKKLKGKLEKEKSKKSEA